MLIFPLNFSKIEDSQPEILYFWPKFFDEKNVSDRLIFRGEIVLLQPFHATALLVLALYITEINSKLYSEVVDVLRCGTKCRTYHAVKPMQ